jgi:hypothetical protein
MGINLDDLPADARKALGLQKSRSKTFTAEHERQRALEILARMTDLTQSERGRVLTRAQRINKV